MYATLIDSELEENHNSGLDVFDVSKVNKQIERKLFFFTSTKLHERTHWLYFSWYIINI